MQRTLMKSKLHNATITQADLHYEGSITIDSTLMQKADIVEGERVQIVNLDNGERIETYVIPGAADSGIIGMNGPAALRCKKGHKVHIISYALLDDNESIKKKVVILDGDNKVKKEINQ